MNERKDLDRLFQEKFKDFEVTPPEFVWENIQEALQEKKKRRVIPLWIRLSGIAAILAIGGLLVTLYFNDTAGNIDTNPVVIDNPVATPADALKKSPTNTPGTPAAASEETNSGKTESDVNTAVAVGEEKTNNDQTTTNQDTNGVKNTSVTNPVFINNNNAVAHESQNGQTTNNKSGRNIKNTKATQQNEAIVSSGKNHKANGNADKKSDRINAVLKSGIINNNANEGIATAEKSSDNKNAIVPTSQNDRHVKQQTINKNNIAVTEGIAATDKSSGINHPANANGEQNDKSKTGINKDIVPAKEEVAISEINTAEEKGLSNPATDNSHEGNTIIDKNIPVSEAVLAQAEATDSTAIAPENELEKLLQEKLNGEKKDEEAVAEQNKGKWNVKPQIAPIFYNSLTEGSPINEQFSSNNKTYDNELSFGIGVNYALNDRMTIRSGINSVNLNYSTNDIAYHASLNAQTTNISETRTSANIVVVNPGDVTDPVFIIDGQPTQAVSGSMLQKTGYIEVPLEMSYALVNKKFGVDIIGGVSTLFLNQNNVSVVSSQGLKTEVGQAENLNNVHFSTNVGLGFKYRFLDFFEANFEPMFKYQVNTFSKDAGNFKPYFIGLYTGISFSF